MFRHRFPMVVLLLSILTTSFGMLRAQDPAQPSSDRWEADIQRFEKQDAQSPPPKDAILFLGSSSIRMWKLENYFADLPVYNRGFGGSQIVDSLNFADRIVVPYHPRTIVFYAGDNDLAAGKSPEQVADDFRRFVELVHQKLPETKIVYLSIKICNARWNNVEKVRQANRLIAEAAEKDPLVTFVDVAATLLDEQGKPQDKYFLGDKLHLNEDGYRLWADVVRPCLQ